MFQSDVLRSQWPVTQRREFISSGCSQGMLFRDTPQKNLYIAQPKYMALKICKICNKQRFS